MILLKRICISFFVVAVLMLAVVMGGLRLAIMNIEYFKAEIEYLFERDLAPGFEFTGLSGDLNRFNPILRIENVSMTLPDQSQPLFIDRLEMEFDFWASWRANAPVLLAINGRLEKLEVIKDATGNWSTNDFSLMIDPDLGPAHEFRQILALVPRYMNLTLNRLIVHDRKAGVTHQLDRIDAKIDHRKDQFFVKLSAALPEQLGQGVLIKSIVSPESSVIYLNSSNLQLAPAARLFDLDTWGLQQGALDGEVWINMSGYKLLAVNGDLVLKNGLVQTVPDKAPLAISYRSRFSALALEPGWRIGNWLQRLNIDNQNITGFHTQLDISGGPDNRVVSAWIDRLPLSSLPIVARPWLSEKVGQQVAQGSLEGKLQDILLRVELERPQAFAFTGRAFGVRSQASGGYPGIKNVNADILIGNERMGFQVYGSRIELDFGDHFDAPLELANLELTANVKRIDDGLILAVDDLEFGNQDVKAAGRAWLEFDRDEPPFTYIRAGFSDADGRSVSKYIPRNYMPLAAQAWLDRGIKNGYVPEGELQFHGRLRDIRDLNREQAGEFFVDFELERGDVFFSPGWLHATNGAGRMLFHNVGMYLNLDRVGYDQIDNARATASIVDFDKPRLEIKVETESTGALAVGTWLDTPVGKQYRRVMSNLQDIGGGVSSEINLSMPLDQDDPRPEVRVLVNFDNVSARSESWGIDLTQANGRLEVTQSTFKARSIKAIYFGDPITIDIDTLQPSGNTLVGVRGKVETRKLLNKLPPYLTSKIDGKSDWRVDLNFPRVSTSETQPFLRVYGTSELKHTAIGLPPPFIKSAADTTPVTATVEYFPDQIRFQADMGNDIRWRGQLIPDQARSFRLDMLDIAFSSELRLEPRQGLHLYGSIAHASVEEWVKFVKSSGEANPAFTQTAQLHFDQLRFFNQEIDNLRLDLTQVDESFVVDLESDKITGKFVAPWQSSASNPVVIDLDYLQIDKIDDETAATELHPLDLFDFNLNSKDILFRDMRFSNLQVEARPTADKLIVDSLKLQKDDLTLTGQAQWDYDAASQSHVSSVTMYIKGDNMGTAIAGLGFGDTMQQGTLNFSGGFTWPAPLVEFSVENLVGDARFRIEDGVLNDVEPGGGGKFVGLFSLGALPRRLALDFSDILIKGMEFDQIIGTYRIEQGILYTDNTKMDGTSASIKISGKTDIAKREYDQNIRVTPKIRQTLPVLGAISAGSAVGWGLLLLQNLFKKAIDDAVEVEYQISGSWDDPKIELIKAVDENQQELPQIDR